MNIKLELSDNCYYIKLNRGLKGNALNSDSIDQLLETIDQVSANANAKCLVILADGKNFCTGLDLNWLKKCSLATKNNIETETIKLEQVFNKLDNLNIAKIAIIHGKVIGAGIGLIATCNLVIADNKTEFSLPELSIGILPAVILPYLINVIGKSKARAYAITKKPWDAQRALQDGLVHYTSNSKELKALGEQIISNILQTPTKSLQDFIVYSENPKNSAQQLTKAILANRTNIANYCNTKAGKV